MLGDSTAKTTANHPETRELFSLSDLHPAASSVRSEIFVEPCPKQIQSSVRGGICRSYGAGLLLHRHSTKMSPPLGLLRLDVPGRGFQSASTRCRQAPHRANVVFEIWFVLPDCPVADQDFPDSAGEMDRDGLVLAQRRPRGADANRW